jgi:hypothetical protein
MHAPVSVLGLAAKNQALPELVLISIFMYHAVEMQSYGLVLKVWTAKARFALKICLFA